MAIYIGSRYGVLQARTHDKYLFRDIGEGAIAVVPIHSLPHGIAHKQIQISVVFCVDG